MNEKLILQESKRAGFVKAAVMSTSDLSFHHEFRMFCEQNDCGNYKSNYACPPYCGTPEEMEQKAMQFRQAIVFQSRTPVENVFDEIEMKKIKKSHTIMTFDAVNSMIKQGFDSHGIYIMCGPCNYCKECAAISHNPCVQEDQRFSCLSAYCIDAMDMAKKCEMAMEWNGKIVSFFSMYLFDKII